MKKLFVGLSIIAIAFISTIAMAIEFDVPKDDTSSANVSLDTEVLDNYFAAGNQVTTDAKVDGDAFLFANIVKVKNEVTNNAFVGAQSVDVTGNIGRDLFVGASDFTLDKDATVGGNLYVGAAFATINGTVKGDVYVGAGTLTINGTVEGKIKAQVDALELGAKSVVGGDIEYTSKNDLKISDGAIYGEVVKKTPVSTKVDFRTGPFWSVKILSLLGNLLVGIILLTLFPKKTTEIVETIKSNFWSSLGWGLFFLIVVPILALIFMIIMIGLPLSIILLGFYLLALYFANIYVGLCFGNYLTKGNWSPIWSMTLGVVLLFIIYQLPWIGGIAGLIILLAGLGGIMLVAKQAMGKK